MSTNGTTPTKPESPASERLLTPTKISAWLECGHHMTLTSAVEAGTLRVTNGHLGAFARLLLEKGMDHERATLEKLRSNGLSVLSVPSRNPQTESFTEWCERVRPLLAEGHEIVYQFPMTHEGIRGIADFLVKVDTPSDLGPFSYEPGDAKLARVEAKPAHVLQLCFYADGLAAIQGIRPTTAHLFLGSGETEKIALAEVEAYWQRVRRNIFSQLTAETLPQTSPEPCQHCAFCEFADHCDAQWRDQDAIHFVSGITRRERDLCATAEVTTLHGLAANADQVIDIRPDRYDYLRTQAQLQAAATPGDIPPWQLRPIDEVHEDPSDDDNTGPHDYRLRLPAPDLGDGEDVTRITRRQVVTNAVPKQHDDGAVSRRSLEEAQHRGRDLPLHLRHDATPTRTDGSAANLRTAASSKPAAENNRLKCSTERSRPPVAISRCRSQSAPATLSSGTNISTT